ncbi:PEP-CTERM protein-sorting domain-containing protein [Saccharopolyspora kobensis]|uniref:PEP-CTERM protein-sorting domain-containing protein n=1 Tax=Saccharopolyspora kobensis TaxID=146035 RepID=A0A1H5TI95_9PSEU|nr:hypothetical protein [Saccharopolyspora kobensis]SEF61727.1 PEP-CTERM protein-sorting domain-containing protein [Saccharopolyspora kobensis]SFC46839.1 PEP-CTERM protein-sorting domain-containing protein [Saccharopolyspora kobensis]
MSSLLVILLPSVAVLLATGFPGLCLWRRRRSSDRGEAFTGETEQAARRDWMLFVVALVRPAETVLAFGEQLHRVERQDQDRG